MDCVGCAGFTIFWTVSSICGDGWASRVSNNGGEPMKQTNWAYWIAGQAGVIPIAVGMPGVAKTESTRALAKAAGRRFLPVMLDQILPEALGGHPAAQRREGKGHA